MTISKVEIGKQAKKQLEKVPSYIADKLDEWIEAVEADGIHEVRKIPGYHDEPLHGHRKDQRSVRLSKAYRAIYEQKANPNFELITIEEVSKHDY